MKRILLATLVLLFSACAFAKPHQLSWALPTTTCDNDPLAASDILDSELAIDTQPMPMPSDTFGPCDPNNVDTVAPASATVVPIAMPSTVTQLNLQPGVTYYARIRISAYTAGNWSAWSQQATFTVPYGRPQRVIISGGKYGKLEYQLVGVSQLSFNGRR